MDDEREVTELEQAEAELEECENDLIDVAKQRDAALARADRAEAALAAVQAPCVWVKRADGWPTPGCGLGPAVVTGGVFKFCPYCRHPFEVQP